MWRMKSEEHVITQGRSDGEGRGFKLCKATSWWKWICWGRAGKKRGDYDGRQRGGEQQIQGRRGAGRFVVGGKRGNS